MLEFRLPSLGADMDEGKLVEWQVKPGDTVKRGDVVAVVETTKAAIDVECWMDGIVGELLAEPGVTLPVGTPLALLREPGETDEQFAAAKAARAAASPAPAGAAPAPVPAAAAAPAPPAEGRRRISPAARKHAEELGVDIATLEGTGPQGAVTLEDVERAAAARKAPPLDRAAEMRKTIAAAMARSKREIPHYYLSEAVPLRRATDWLLAANGSRPPTERLLMAAVFIKAVALALRKFPDMNGFCRDGIFQTSTAINVGVAISLRQGGLIAPALLETDRKPVEQVMKELADLVKRTRAGSLRSSELSEPTITVTNLGDQGVDSVHPVIYPPQVAIVGFGRVSERPWVADGKIGAMPAVTASLAADHRVSDGHRGALFLAEIRNLLLQPENL